MSKLDELIETLDLNVYDLEDLEIESGCGCGICDPPFENAAAEDQADERRAGIPPFDPAERVMPDFMRRAISPWFR